MDTIITAVLTIVLAHLVWGFILWLRVRKLYSYPGLLGFPVFGNLYYFYKTLFAFTADSMVNQMIRVNEKCGKDGLCFHFIYGYKIAAIVSSPEIVKKLSFHPNLGDKPYEIYAGFHDYMKGPFSIQHADEAWKLKRKEYNIFLRRSNVNNDYFNSFAKSADKFVDKLSTSSDGHGLSLAITHDASFKTLFGIDTDLVYHPEVVKIMNRLMDMGGIILANSNVVRALGPVLRPLFDVVHAKAVELRKMAIKKIENTLLYKKEPLSATAELTWPCELERNPAGKPNDFQQTENACYFSVTKVLSSRLLFRNLKIRIFKTIILPTVVYGCETWPLTLRDEQRLKVFENKVLRRIFGPKKDELTGEFRRLHNAELRELYPGNIIEVISSRRIKWACKVVGLSNERIPKRLIFAVPNGKRPRGRPKRRWEDCIKADLKGLGLDGERWREKIDCLGGGRIIVVQIWLRKRICVWRQVMNSRKR
ncbi:unnamed protein product [Nezara viridula]|uniref:Cytochrome P450 n=1 Tax=Nezara viridula TaxID=85310 RepID=A0A9P0H8K6_NEZVI|nr:unnamed protein product [Nezara viridula]